MNWRYMLGLSATAALGLAFLPQGAVAQKSIKDQIVGAWAIVSQVQTMKDGNTRHPAGMNPKGVNVFTADGQFVVLFMRDDLPKLAAGDRQKATAEEARAVVGGSIGYFGTYTVDEFEQDHRLQDTGNDIPESDGDRAAARHFTAHRGRAEVSQSRRDHRRANRGVVQAGERPTVIVLDM